MNWPGRLDAAIRALLGAVLVASIFGLAATMTAQVILRYLLQWPLMGVEEMSTLFGLWIYFSGFALVSVNNQHIRGGFLGGLLSERMQAAVDRAFLAACAAICLYVFILSLDYAHFVWSVNRRSTFLRWPTMLWVASLNVGLFLSVVTLTLQALFPGRKSAT